MVDMKNSRVLKRTSILGVPVDIVTLDHVSSILDDWTDSLSFHTVFVREVGSLMLTYEKKSLLDLHKKADLVVPDGMPLVWIAKLRGYGREIDRVAGADLMARICKDSIVTKKSHYFYGGLPGVAEDLADKLSSMYPGLIIAGVFSPPMRDIDEGFTATSEILDEIANIKYSKADYIWIGISSPKQEYFMMKAAPLIGRGVFIGVGAAFDFLSGRSARAPRWMQRFGLEWLFRFMCEPRRLRRRYLVLAPRFVVHVFVEQILKRWTGTQRITHQKRDKEGDVEPVKSSPIASRGKPFKPYERVVNDYDAQIYKN
ncbi:MAG: WecB/TagA/CpsF family glycosyltransferase [Xanthobacteraceae bacterium]